MLFIGFVWAFAMTALSLIVMTLVSYAFPNSLIGKTFGIVK